MSSDDIRFRAERRDRICVLAVSGALGVSSSAAFADRVAAERAARPERLVLDMSGVGYLDSGGARALLAAVSPAPGACPVIVRSLRPAARRVLELIGSDLARPAPRPAWAGQEPPPGGWDGRALAGSATWDLVRRSQDLRLSAEQAIADSRRVARLIASTEDDIAATLLHLATRRPNQSDHLTALSEEARAYAVRLRDGARHDQVTGLSAVPGRPGGGAHHASGTLRRAIAFIEERADDDISVADVAAAACVTVRTIQLAFRRRLGTTPLGYLRQVRLERAHRQLLAADPDQATVTMIATRWGFSSASRFTAYYRAAYGVRPSQTLSHRPPAGRGLPACAES